jgi:hypothetical protein
MNDESNISRIETVDESYRLDINLLIEEYERINIDFPEETDE